MKIDKEKLTNFIEINHHFMTISEIAEETGANCPLIKRICESNGWKPITIAERMKDFIESHKHLSLEDQADKLGMSDTGLKHHYEKLGIPLPEKKRKNARIDDEPNPIIEEKAEKIIEKVEVKKRERQPINRKAFTTYNQTGSDLLDSLRGIQTTSRNDKLLT